MGNGFRLREGMFYTVPCKSNDRRVMRLKRLVDGHKILNYEPKPVFHFGKKIQRHVTKRKLDVAKPKGKSAIGFGRRASDKNRIQQLRLDQHKKSTLEFHKTNHKPKKKSPVIKPSEEVNVSAVNTVGETPAKQDPPVARPTEKVTVPKHCPSVQKDSPVVSNASTTSTLMDRRAAFSHSSSITACRDSWSRFMDRIRSKKSIHRKLSMSDRGTSLPAKKNPSTSNRTTWNNSKYQPSISFETALQVSQSTNLPASDRLQTSMVHETGTTDSPEKKKSPVRQRMLSIPNRASLPSTSSRTTVTSRHSRVDSKYRPSITRSTAVSVSRSPSLPRVGSSRIPPKITSDSSGNRSSPIQHTSGAASIESKLSERHHQGNNTKIPTKYWKDLTADVSEANRKSSNLTGRHLDSGKNTITKRNRKVLTSDGATGNRQLFNLHTRHHLDPGKSSTKQYSGVNNSSSAHPVSVNHRESVKA